MKKLTLIATLAMLACSAFAFPTNTSTKVVDIAKVQGDWESFRFYWTGQSDQRISLTCSNSTDNTFVDLSAYSVCARVSKDGTVYVDKRPANITVTISNAVFAVARTNVPPNGTYDMELWCFEGATTNLARTLAQGRVTVTKSLYSDTNSYPFPVGVTNLTDYLTIANAAATYAPISTTPKAGTVVEGNSNYVSWIGGGTMVVGVNTNMGAGDITGVTVSGGFLTGGTNQGTADISLSTGALSAVYASNSVVATATQSIYEAHVTNAAQAVDIANLYTSNTAAWRTDGANAPTATMNGGGQAFTNVASIRSGASYYDIVNNRVYDTVGLFDYKAFDFTARRAYSHHTPDNLMFDWSALDLIDFQGHEIRTTGYLTGKVKNGAVSNAPVNVQQMNASNAVLSASINAAITTNIQQTAAIVSLSNKTITAGSGLLGGGTLSTNTTIAADYVTLDARYLVGSTNVFSELYVANRNVLGSEAVVNSNFATNTFGWTNVNFTYLASPGLLLLVYAATNTGYVTPSNALAITSNRTYLLSYAYYNNSTGVTITAIMGGKTNSYFTSTISGGMITNSYLVGVKNLENLRVNVTLGSGSMYLDDISVKPIEGGPIYANEVSAENFVIIGAPTDGRHAITKAMFDAVVISGSNAASWSVFPALQHVGMDKYGVTNMADAVVTNAAVTLQQLMTATNAIESGMVPTNLTVGSTLQRSFNAAVDSEFAKRVVLQGTSPIFITNDLSIQSLAIGDAYDGIAFYADVTTGGTKAGMNSEIGGIFPTAIGFASFASNNSVAVGGSAQEYSAQVGKGGSAKDYATAVGAEAVATDGGIAIGYDAVATNGNVQLGNSSGRSPMTNTVLVYTLPILNYVTGDLSTNLNVNNAIRASQPVNLQQMNASNALDTPLTSYNALTNSVRATNEYFTSTDADLLTNVNARVSTLTYNSLTNSVRASNELFTAWGNGLNTSNDVCSTNIVARLPTATHSAFTNTVRLSNDHFTAWGDGLNASNNVFATNIAAKLPTATYQTLTNSVRATNDYFTAWGTGLNTSNNSFYIAITNLQAGSNANWAPVIGGLQLTNGFVITNLLPFNRPVTNGSIAITGNTAYVTFPQAIQTFGGTITNGSGDILTNYWTWTNPYTNWAIGYLTTNSIVLSLQYLVSETGNDTWDIDYDSGTLAIPAVTTAVPVSVNHYVDTAALGDADTHTMLFRNLAYVGTPSVYIDAARTNATWGPVTIPALPPRTESRNTITAFKYSFTYMLTKSNTVYRFYWKDQKFMLYGSLTPN